MSEGCRNCYAEKVANRFRGPGQSYEGLVHILKQREPGEQIKMQRKPGTWNGQIKFVEERLLDPLRWKRPRRIFVNSMSDLFHPNVTDEMLIQIAIVMCLGYWHTYQVLTKRPENLPRWTAAVEAALQYIEGLKQGGIAHKELFRALDLARRDDYLFDLPLRNVWLGVSVEDQKAADVRIPLLLQTPAAVRFISAEPLLGDIDLEQWIPKPADGIPHGTAFDYEKRQYSGKNRQDIGLLIDLPPSTGLPPLGLHTNVVPADKSAEVYMQPRHDFSRSAVDGDTDRRRGFGTPAPIHVTLAVKEPGEITDYAGVGRDADALRLECGAVSADHNVTPEQRPSHGFSANSGTDSNSFDSQSCDIESGNLSVGHGSSVPQSPAIDWLIVGGESGPGARPMHPDWARSLRDQCGAAGVPFFFKQWGEWAPADDLSDEIAGKASGFGDFGPVTSPQLMLRVGKKAAGRLLDGREWNEFPEWKYKAGGSPCNS